MTWASSSCQPCGGADAAGTGAPDDPAAKADGETDDEAEPAPPLDTPGTLHPASTGSPTPARTDPKTKARRRIGAGPFSCP